jgi:hypothetical protein
VHSNLSFRHLQAHLAEHLGPVDHVFHEIVSETVHVDLFFVAPADERPRWTVVTWG